MVYTTKPPLGTPLDWTHPLNSGLVRFWVFNEGTGNIVNDLSGNEDTGTLTNMAFPSTPTSGWNPGRLGPAISFDGSDDYISTSYMPPAGNITIAYWAKWTSFGDYDASGVNDGANHRLYLGTSYGNVYLGIGNSYKSNVLHGMAVGTWYHYALVISATQGTVYINGVQIDSMSYSQTGVSTLPLYIGATNLTTGAINHQTLMFDEFRVWNRTLSESELIQLINDPYGMFLDTGCPPITCSLNVS